MKTFLKVIDLGILVILLTSCAAEQIKQAKVQQISKNKQAQEADFNTQLAINYIKQGNMVLSKEKLLLALKQYPNSMSANSMMGYYLERTGDTKNAEVYYQQAITVADHKGASENNYATFLCRQKRYDEADTHFQFAIRDPQYVNTAKAYENAGLCAQLIPDPDKAKDYFRYAVQHDPSLIRSRLALANLDYGTSDQAEGYQQIQRFLQMTPPTAEALWLAIRYEKDRTDSVAILKYGAVLIQKFPQSSECQSYLKLKASLQ